MSNILIVGPAHPLRGGIATFNEQLAKSLQQAGHQVEILSFSLQYPDFLFPGTSQFTDEPAPSTLLISPKLNSIQPLNWLRVGNEYRKKSFDIVIFRFWLPFMAPCLGTFSRIMRWSQRNVTKFIAITDNVIPHEKRLGDKLLTRYFLSSCDGFIAMAKSVLNDIALFEPDKPKIYTPHPIYDNYGTPISREEALENLGLSPDFQYVLFFGLIRAYKGLDLLLEAFGEGELKKRKIKLIIAGEPYENMSKYEAIITKYQLENQIIRHTHFIPTEQVANYFCAADLVAQPYKTATQSGVSQIAYHFEKPILVTNVGGLAEIVSHQKVGYVVKPESVEIKNAILDFFDNQRDKEFAENIKLEKKRFSWETMIGKIFELADTL
ncbi:glycosyltransferase [Thermoflexibacter ruber]|uniref:Glycosyltransferase involved in cell wall bisynthesis n=1 Tax=Thermoflexibacter ruber TaxID=1003 RepID=A0A1I2G8K8_9BACT|nr:glycosyltransferase [Thermoflexibacter ruber]SFF13310.1 Glycosyltransferase involved in cell wall bisynthesis [Thermoflexibacter ruber]